MLAPTQAGESPKFRFTLEQGDFAGQAFTATLLICDSPCCGCDGVRFYCQPAAEPRDPSAPALVSPAPLHVDLSVMQGKGDPRPEATRKDLALTRAIVAELQPSEWKQWEQVFLDTKRGLMQTMDLAKIDARFPPEVMEGSSTTVGYLEVFPWAAMTPAPAAAGRNTRSAVVRVHRRGARRHPAWEPQSHDCLHARKGLRLRLAGHVP